MPRRFPRKSLYEINHVESWPEDACCLQNTHRKTLAVQLVTELMSGGSVEAGKSSKGVREENPETSGEKPSKSLCWIIDPPSFPIHKSTQDVCSCSKCMKYWRRFYINDIWITRNVLFVDRANSQRMIYSDAILEKRMSRVGAEGCFSSTAGWEIKGNIVCISDATATVQNEMKLDCAEWGILELWFHHIQAVCIMHPCPTHWCLTWK